MSLGSLLLPVEIAGDTVGCIGDEVVVVIVGGDDVPGCTGSKLSWGIPLIRRE